MISFGFNDFSHVSRSEMFVVKKARSEIALLVFNSAFTIQMAEIIGVFKREKCSKNVVLAGTFRLSI